jgi:glutathione reductase (NADPH)
VLHATGRLPNTLDLGLEEAGVELAPNGAVRVDALFQTRVPSIHAIGDCIDRMQLTPVALSEGMFVADRLFGRGERSVSYDNIPTAVFSHPNVATVGLTEGEARERHGDVLIYRSTFTPLREQLARTGGRVLMKLVVDAATDRVLGVHMVGPEAGEIVQGFAVALTCGATKAHFDATLGIHPTAAEEFVTMRDPVPPPNAA